MQGLNVNTITRHKLVLRFRLRATVFYSLQNFAVLQSSTCLRSCGLVSWALHWHQSLAAGTPQTSPKQALHVTVHQFDVPACFLVCGHIPCLCHPMPRLRRPWDHMCIAHESDVPRLTSPQAGCPCHSSYGRGVVGTSQGMDRVVGRLGLRCALPYTVPASPSSRTPNAAPNLPTQYPWHELLYLPPRRPTDNTVFFTLGNLSMAVHRTAPR
jgi:hypothetical protein